MSSCCAKKEQPVPVFASKLVLYKPLIIILGLSIAGAGAVSYGSGLLFMNLLMGFFLLFLSMLKLFNVRGFAETFGRYDVVAKKIPLYGTFYPFIELFLALLYFSAMFPVATNIVMTIIMLVGSIGVVQIIKTNANVQCGCVGNVFNLPVGRVTLAENLTMGAMAAMNLVHYL